jgi:hypothetical protein
VVLALSVFHGLSVFKLYFCVLLAFVKSMSLNHIILGNPEPLTVEFKSVKLDAGAATDYVLTSDAVGNASWQPATTDLPTLTNGQLLIGRTSLSPVAANLTAGSGISVTNGSGSITLASTTAARSYVYTISGNVTITASAGAQQPVAYNTTVLTNAANDISNGGSGIFTFNNGGVYTVSQTLMTTAMNQCIGSFFTINSNAPTYGFNAGGQNAGLNGGVNSIYVYQATAGDTIRASVVATASSTTGALNANNCFMTFTKTG